MYSSPYPFADFMTGIAIEMGTEDSSGFIAEEQKGWVLRDAVVLQKRSRSRSYVQKMAWKKAGRRFGSRENQVKEVDFWGVMNSEG